MGILFLNKEEIFKSKSNPTEGELFLIEKLECINLNIKNRYY